MKIIEKSYAQKKKEGMKKVRKEIREMKEKKQFVKGIQTKPMGEEIAS